VLFNKGVLLATSLFIAALCACPSSGLCRGVSWRGAVSEAMNNSFEDIIRELTQPINGQYPRPWMTKLQDPLQAKVFIVGKNQAKTFSAQQVGSHNRLLHALFNRNGETCRDLYNQVTSTPSPTRHNIDALTNYLEHRGIGEILETNVICYSTPMSSDLAQTLHQGSKQRGSEIFQTLLLYIHPPILIAHGSDTRKELGRVLGVKFISEPKQADEVIYQRVSHKGYEPIVFIIPSLALPAYNRWQRWASAHLNNLADEVAHQLDRYK